MKNLKLFLLAIVLLFAAVGCAPSQSSALQASGQIEATEIAVAPELSGRVTDVYVSEGDAVKTGDPLLKLDGSLLLSEKRSAEAALDAAKAGGRAAQVALDAAQLQFDLTLDAALAAESPTRVSIWDASKPTEFDQPVWYFSSAERLQAARSAVDAAKTALDAAMTKLADTEKKAGSAQFLQVEAALAQARQAFQIARDVLDRTNGTSDGQSLRDAAQANYDEKKTDLDNAQKDYDDALTTDGANDVLQARAEAAIAQETYDRALDQLRALQTGENSPLVQTAAKAVEQAQAQLDLAQASVTAAQANLDALNTQMEKLTVYAPMDGVILTRGIHVGEVAQAGAAVMTIGDLSKLTITVYLSEDRYGEVNVGDEVSFTADSFPNETFAATVTRIADQAEFTPRNVQTKEERQTTVYAIELTVNNPDGKLKPGMPVDVTFK
ncbi:MAG: HlyD family efflux transporter periplasmic adaptor subunit [Anaerolineaceae bacterium]|nr:MAG: HlyD family efflux transporter periplasmic adaptor subunit [Anaerolineaceae bacterium]